MQVILIEDVANLGSVGDMVKVKPGYARNHLLPKSLAVVASVKNKRELEHQKKITGFKAAKARAADQVLLDKLASCQVTLSRKVGEHNKLYGSVTTKDLEQGLADAGVEVDRRKIQLPETIKTLGDYDVTVKFRTGVAGTFKLSVVAEEGDSE